MWEGERKTTAARNSRILRTIPLLIAICLISFPVQAKYGGVMGEPNDPYQIATAADLIALGEMPADYDKHFKLTADIDLSGFDDKKDRPVFNIIGIDDSSSFSGVFDGNGHTITNFVYDTNEVNHIGLFGYIFGEGAQILNLVLIDPNVDGGTSAYVGALVGCMERGSIVEDCYVIGGTVRGGYCVGGLVGRHGVATVSRTITNSHATTSITGRWCVGGLVGLNEGMITDCSAAGIVSADGSVGGLVGRNLFGTIINSHANGLVSGNWRAGGLAGYNGGTGTIASCHSSADVQGGAESDEIGGLVGGNWGNGIIVDCYSTGSVSGKEYIGGLVGENYQTVMNCYSVGPVMGVVDVGGLIGVRSTYGPGAVTDSFWDVETSGQTTSAGGTGKTTAEMQMESTFTDAGWDFVDETDNGSEDIWRIDEGLDYPRLWWELTEDDSPTSAD
jgi:hypothetical protein